MAEYQQPSSTFRGYLQTWLATPTFQGPAGRRWVHVMGGLFDRAHQALQDTVLGRYTHGRFGPAYDAPRHLGNERSMPQYATETWAQFVARLDDAWPTWEEAGDESAITRQLDLAGFPGAEIFRWTQDGSWSEFAVFFPQGTHPVTAQGREYGEPGLTYGEPGLVYGPLGINGQQVTTIKKLILHWKPARWKCRYVIWEISGATYGTGHTYGEAGLVYGGEQARTTVQL